MVCPTCNANFDGRRRACTECGAPRDGRTVATATKPRPSRRAETRTRDRVWKPKTGPARSRRAPVVEARPAPPVVRSSAHTVKLDRGDAQHRTFPSVCAKTGEYADNVVRMHVQRTPWWAYLFLLFGFLVGILVLIAIRSSGPSAEIYVPLKRSVRQRRMLYSIVGVLSLITGPVMLITGAATSSIGEMLWGALFLLGGVAGIVAARRQMPGTRIENDYVELRRLHPAFVSALESQTAADAYPEFENTSGLGSQARLPRRLRGFNWGALWLSWIWGLGNQVYIALLVFIPFISPFVALWLGFKGNELAWKARRWESVDAFRRTQRRWALGGGLTVLFSTIAVFVIAAIAAPTPTATRPFVPPADAPTAITSSDGSVEISVPSTWSEDPSLHPDAAIQASSRVDELYVVVFADGREMFAPNTTRKQLAQLTRDELVASLDGGRVHAVTTRTIDGMGATVSEVSGAIDGLDVVYLSVVVETPTRFVELETWTLSSGFAEKEATMYSVIDSLRERAPASGDIVPA